MAITQDKSEILTPPYGYTPASSGSVGTQLASTISNIVGILTLIAALAFIYYIVLATINLTITGGDQEKAKKASQMLTNSLIGIALTAAAYPLIYLLGQLLGVPFDSPTQLIGKLF